MSDEFWNQRATVLNYHAGLYAEKKLGLPVAVPTVASPDELFRQAEFSGGLVSFEDECLKRGIDRSLHSLEACHVATAASLGLLGAVVAICTDLIARHVEPQILSEYDKNSPTDYLKGINHRYYFGHDILNPLQKLPEGFKYLGRDVGGKSLWQMMWTEYGSGAGVPSRILNVLMHSGVHYLRDIITPTGMPLPGSSYFTKFEERILNSCGFARRNAFMDALGREYGSVHMSDFTSLAVIELLQRTYMKRVLGQSGSSFDKQVLQGQVATIAYGTCLVAQLGFLATVCINQPALRPKLPGAKLNHAVGILFVKNAISLVRLVHREHGATMMEYDRSIRLLSDSRLSVDDWIRSL